jgi:hypothetical protein
LRPDIRSDLVGSFVDDLAGNAEQTAEAMVDHLGKTLENYELNLASLVRGRIPGGVSGGVPENIWSWVTNQPLTASSGIGELIGAKFRLSAPDD